MCRIVVFEGNGFSHHRGYHDCTEISRYAGVAHEDCTMSAKMAHAASLQSSVSSGHLRRKPIDHVCGRVISSSIELIKIVVPG
jgi:hypothetical protein